MNGTKMADKETDEIRILQQEVQAINRLMYGQTVELLAYKVVVAALLMFASNPSSCTTADEANANVARIANAARLGILNGNFDAMADAKPEEFRKAILAEIDVLFGSIKFG